MLPVFIFLWLEGINVSDPCNTIGVNTSTHVKRKVTELKTWAVTITFCGLTPTPGCFHCFGTVAVVFSCMKSNSWELLNRPHHHRPANLLQSAVLSRRLRTNAEYEDVLCWLLPCSSCSSNQCVTVVVVFVFFTQSRRCEQRKWQRWVECWSHVWFEHRR